MTDFAWFPVTGDGQSPATAYTWNAGTFVFSTGTDWVNVDILQYPYLTGVVPGSGASVGMNVSQGPADAAYLVSAEILTALLNPPFYNPNPALGDPYVASGPGTTTLFPVSVLLNSGSVTLTTLGLGQANASLLAPIFPTLDIEGATLTITGNVLDTFSKTFPPPFGMQTASGGGNIDLGSGGTFSVAGTVGTPGTPDIIVTFEDANGNLLTLGGVSSTNTGAFAGQIHGFVPGDVIDLPSVSFAAGPTKSYDPTAQTLTVTSGTTTDAVLEIVGSYTTASFTLQPDATGGTEVVTCFAAGTRILTTEGERAIEQLEDGDRVAVVIEAGTQPVVWIGRRKIDCSRHPRPERVWPVRIAPGAFGEGRPLRPLLLSPDHSVYVDGVLIPVKLLTNGGSIAQEPTDSVTYYHIELPRHEVVLAEGLPVESWLPCEDRSSFDNGGGPVALYPEFYPLIWEAEGCAPLVLSGPQLERVRDRLCALDRERAQAA